jgi:hypothetical protein
MIHNVELPPPSWAAPIMDVASLACPSDPPPIRTAEKWIHGDALWHPERELMYELAEQQLIERGYNERQRNIAVLIARCFSNEQITDELNISPSSVTYTINALYSDTFHHPTRTAVANQVVWLGMRQLVVRSLTELSPDSSPDELFDQSWRLLGSAPRKRKFRCWQSKA